MRPTIATRIGHVFVAGLVLAVGASAHALATADQGTPPAPAPAVAPVSQDPADYSSNPPGGMVECSNFRGMFWDPSVAPCSTDMQRGS